jgi:hypothetical protein
MFECLVYDVLAEADIIPVEQHFHETDEFLESGLDLVEDPLHGTNNCVDGIKDSMIDILPNLCNKMQNTGNRVLINSSSSVHLILHLLEQATGGGTDSVSKSVRSIPESVNNVIKNFSNFVSRIAKSVTDITPAQEVCYIRMVDLEHCWSHWPMVSMH